MTKASHSLQLCSVSLWLLRHLANCQRWQDWHVKILNPKMPTGPGNDIHGVISLQQVSTNVGVEDG